jgi:hypothetical protein
VCKPGFQNVTDAALSMLLHFKGMRKRLEKARVKEKEVTACYYSMMTLC